MSLNPHPEQQQLAPQAPAKYEPLRSLRSLLEYLGGARDLLPRNAWPWLDSPAVHVLSWVVMLVIIYFFCGQSSRFIYIDF